MVNRRIQLILSLVFPLMIALGLIAVFNNPEMYLISKSVLVALKIAVVLIMTTVLIFDVFCGKTE